MCREAPSARWSDGPALNLSGLGAALRRAPIMALGTMSEWGSLGSLGQRRSAAVPCLPGQRLRTM